MKTMARFNLAVVLLSCTICLDASAATRVCSVYAESFSALQKQIFQGAEIFEAPALGALPMMITGVMPGAAQLDNSKPVAVHVISMGGADVELLIEAAPSGEAQAYLKALAGGDADAALPEPENGIYKLGAGGMGAKIAKGRLFFTPNADAPAAVLADGVIGSLPDLPTLPGALRVALAPAAVAPLLENLKKEMMPDPDDEDDDADAKKARTALVPMMDMYIALLSQIDALYLGLDVQKEGLFIRTRLAPKEGTDMAAWIASVKPAAPADLAFIEKGSLISYAAGQSALPEKMRQQIVDYYMGLVTATPMFASISTNEMAAVLNSSFKTMGVPAAFTCRPPADDGALRILGKYTFDDPAAYVAEQVALQKNPAMQKFSMMTGEPGERTGKNDLKITSWTNLFDEKALTDMLREAMPAGMEQEDIDKAMKSQQEMIGPVRKLFGNTYEFAADGKHVVWGMGAPAMVEEAAERARNAGKASAEAERIEALLNPSGDPNSLGLISLSEMFRLGIGLFDAKLADAAKAVPAGEGIVFTGWPFKGEVLTALLVPPSEVKAITALGQVMQSNSPQRGAPARPPIPDNF